MDQDEDKHHHEDFIDMISDLVHEYLQEEFIQFFKASFMEHSVQNIASMVSSINETSMDVPINEDTVFDLIEDCLKDALQEDYGIEPRVLPSCLAKDRLYYGPLPSFAQSMEQKTDEWYSVRHNLLTATAISSLFGSQAKANEVIYEKCRPLAPQIPLSVYDARHWGVRYEPVSRAIYEWLYKTKVEEFGCLVHPDWPFIGASPDGINMDPKNRERYGRMVEIKNVVSREITGDPLDDYWIQMQIQMEVCDLDTCDFVETRIKEFDSFDDYDARANDYDLTGLILHFMVGLQHEYAYYPVGNSSYGLKAVSMEKWIQKEVDKRSRTHQYVGPIYWYLEEFSCVVVPRCRAWFLSALPRIEEVWNTILKERVEGYEHRKPNKRTRQQNDVGSITVIKLE